MTQKLDLNTLTAVEEAILAALQAKKEEFKSEAAAHAAEGNYTQAVQADEWRMGLTFAQGYISSTVITLIGETCDALFSQVAPDAPVTDVTEMPEPVPLAS